MSGSDWLRLRHVISLGLKILATGKGEGTYRCQQPIPVPWGPFFLGWGSEEVEGRVEMPVQVWLIKPVDPTYPRSAPMSFQP